MFKTSEISPYCWNIIHTILIFILLSALIGFFVKRTCYYTNFTQI